MLLSHAAHLACRTEGNSLATYFLPRFLAAAKKTAPLLWAMRTSVRKELITVTVIVSTIRWSDLLWKRQHLCFLTCLLPQKELHFWIVHDRVTMHRTYCTQLQAAAFGPTGCLDFSALCSGGEQDRRRLMPCSPLLSSPGKSLPWPG